MSPQNIALSHVDYFELKTIKDPKDSGIDYYLPFIIWRDYYLP